MQCPNAKIISYGASRVGNGVTHLGSNENKNIKNHPKWATLNVFWTRWHEMEVVLESSLPSREIKSTMCCKAWDFREHTFFAVFFANHENHYSVKHEQ